MPCLARWVSACTLVGLIFGGGDARAQSVVLESAELGTTGRIGGTSISTAQYVGWRFQVAEPLMVERVGGHLLTYPDVPGEIFAALVRPVGDRRVSAGFAIYGRRSRGHDAVSPRLSER